MEISVWEHLTKQHLCCFYFRTSPSPQKRKELLYIHPKKKIDVTPTFLWKPRWPAVSNDICVCVCVRYLGGGFNIFLCSPRYLGEMIQFDLRIFFRWVVKSHQLGYHWHPKIRPNKKSVLTSRPAWRKVRRKSVGFLVEKYVQMNLHIPCGKPWKQTVEYLWHYCWWFRNLAPVDMYIVEP